MIEDLSVGNYRYLIMYDSRNGIEECKEVRIMNEKLTDERLNEMIEAIKIFADMPYGMQINEINSKDIYAAFLELQERRKFKLDELIEN